MELTENQKLHAEIVNKAWEDANFKARLVADPVATIEEFTGRKLNLPEGKRMVVRDQTDENKVFINIPAAPKAENAELSEDQLEKVAGGCFENSQDSDFKPWTPTFPEDLFGPSDPTKSGSLL